MSRLQGLPESDFTRRERRRDLIRDLKPALDALEDLRFEEAEGILEEALRDLNGITDAAAAAQIRADLEAVLDEVPDHDKRHDRWR